MTPKFTWRDAQVHLPHVAVALLSWPVWKGERNASRLVISPQPPALSAGVISAGRRCAPLTGNGQRRPSIARSRGARERRRAARPRPARRRVVGTPRGEPADPPQAARVNGPAPAGRTPPNLGCCDRARRTRRRPRARLPLDDYTRHDATLRKVRGAPRERCAALGRSPQSKRCRTSQAGPVATSRAKTGAPGPDGKPPRAVAGSMSAQMSAAASERRSSASRIVRHSASSVRPQAVGGVLAAIAARAVSVQGRRPGAGGSLNYHAPGPQRRRRRPVRRSEAKSPRSLSDPIQRLATSYRLSGF